MKVTYEVVCFSLFIMKAHPPSYLVLFYGVDLLSSIYPCIHFCTFVATTVFELCCVVNFYLFVLAQCSLQYPSATRAPGPVELLHWFDASTFPAVWLASSSLVSIHFSMVVHGIEDAPPSAVTHATVHPLRILICEKWAELRLRIQRRLTREPHVTEVGQAERRVRGFI